MIHEAWWAHWPKPVWCFLGSNNVNIKRHLQKFHARRISEKCKFLVCETGLFQVAALHERSTRTTKASPNFLWICSCRFCTETSVGPNGKRFKAFPPIKRSTQFSRCFKNALLFPDWFMKDKEKKQNSIHTFDFVIVWRCILNLLHFFVDSNKRALTNRYQRT